MAMKNKVDYLLGKVSEEANEVGMVIGKIHAFGLGDTHSEDPKAPTNLEALHNELCDLIGSWRMLCAEVGADPGLDEDRIETKPHRIAYWSNRSVQNGQLESNEFKYFEDPRPLTSLRERANELRTVGLTEYVRRCLVVANLNMSELADALGISNSALHKALNERMSDDLKEKLANFLATYNLLPPNFEQAVQCLNKKIVLKGLSQEHKMLVVRLADMLSHNDADKNHELLNAVFTVTAEKQGS